MALNAEEKVIAKKIALRLSNVYVGKQNAISATVICGRLEDDGHHISKEKFRSMIHFLRLQGYRICSNSKGYYYAANKEELKETFLSLKERIKVQMSTLKALEKMIINN